MKIRNLSGTPRVIDSTSGPVEVPAGGTVEVDNDLGRSLCEQADRWKRVTNDKKEG